MRKHLISILYIVISTITILGTLTTKAADNESDKSKRASTGKIGASDWSAATGKVEKVFDGAASMQGIGLSQEAKDSITKEVFREGKYKGESPDKISISPSEAEELINAIKTKTKKAEVTRELTNSIIIEKKIKQVNLTLSQDIYRNAEASGVTLSKGVEELIKSDLEMQTKEMAKSGLSTTEIKDRNQGYLRAIYTAISTNSLNKASFDKASFDKARYQNAKSIIFKPLIKLTITSSPEGSDVEVSNTPIGKTAIQEKQFESNKEYTFIFRLPGYKISERKYFVNSYPPQQKLDEILIKEE